MSGKGPVDEFLRALTQRDAAATVAAAKSAKLEVVPLDVKGAMGTKGKQYFAELFGSFPELEVEVVRKIVAGNKALVELVLRGTPKEPYLDIPVKDGKTLNSRQAWRIDLADDGSVAALKVFFCLNELKWSLGANKTYEEAIAVGAVGGTP
jgi:hypothetical protein